MIRRRSNDVCWCGSKRKFKKCHGEFHAPLEPLRPGRVAPPRPVPDDIERPWYVRDGDTRPDRASVQIIDEMRDLSSANEREIQHAVEDGKQRLVALSRAAATLPVSR